MGCTSGAWALPADWNESQLQGLRSLRPRKKSPDAIGNVDSFLNLSLNELSNGIAVEYTIYM